MNGWIVDEYVLEEKISQGGFGELWKAHHREDSAQKVAIKILPDDNWLDILKNEAQTLENLSHPAICRALESNLDGDPPYIILEYVHGQNLRKILEEQGPFTLEQSLQWMQEILEILSYLHNQGVVHCDLKPENIMIEEDGSLKLLDFGLSATPKKEASQMLLSGALDTASRQGHIAGTLQYMAPEQKKGEVPSPETDIYALGVMFFELLTKELPEFGDVPSKFTPQLPEAVDEIFLKAVSRRSERYHSAQEFSKVLEELEWSLQPTAAYENLERKDGQEEPATGLFASIGRWKDRQVRRWNRFKEGVRYTVKMAYKITKIAILVVLIVGLALAVPHVYKAGIVDSSKKEKKTWTKIKDWWKRNVSSKEEEQLKESTGKSRAEIEKYIEKIKADIETYKARHEKPDDTFWAKVKDKLKDILAFLGKRGQDFLELIKNLLHMDGKGDKFSFSEREREGLKKIKLGLKKLKEAHNELSRNPPKSPEDFRVPPEAMKLIREGRKALGKEAGKKFPELFLFLEKELEVFRKAMKMSQKKRKESGKVPQEKEKEKKVEKSLPSEKGK